MWQKSSAIQKISVILSLAIVIARVFVFGCFLFQIYKNFRYFPNNQLVKFHRAHVKYVNYDAIEVPTVAEIPYDYYGEMGVPITFMQKYNPAQFEIIGSSRQLGKKMKDCVDKDAIYAQGGVRFYLDEGNNHYKRLWDRMVIKRKKEE